MNLNKHILLNRIVAFIGSIKWKGVPIPVAHSEEVRALLVPNYYIILTRRSNHLSTYLIGLADLVLRGKFGYWSHSLMNLENTGEPQLVEAIGTGVQYSTFESVFSCQSVALLKPKSMSLEAWTAVLDRARTDVGKPYDTLFDLKNSTAVSCVELVRDALMAEPNYFRDFAQFEYMIQTTKNLTPQMFYDCEDFVIVHEIRT